MAAVRVQVEQAVVLEVVLEELASLPLEPNSRQTKVELRELIEVNLTIHPRHANTAQVLQIIIKMLQEIH